MIRAASASNRVAILLRSLLSCLPGFLINFHELSANAKISGQGAAAIRAGPRPARYRLTVIGIAPNGVTDLAGDLLDRQHSGQAGSNFVAKFTA
jgi:hypothetical protein